MKDGSKVSGKNEKINKNKFCNDESKNDMVKQYNYLVKNNGCLILN